MHRTWPNHSVQRERTIERTLRDASQFGIAGSSYGFRFFEDVDELRKSQMRLIRPVNFVLQQRAYTLSQPRRHYLHGLYAAMCMLPTVHIPHLQIPNNNSTQVRGLSQIFRNLLISAGFPPSGVEVRKEGRGCAIIKASKNE